MRMKLGTGRADIWIEDGRRTGIAVHYSGERNAQLGAFSSRMSYSISYTLNRICTHFDVKLVLREY